MRFSFHRRQPYRSRAFTLVEMLVVISIISMLAALMLVAVNTGIATARRTQCANNLKQLQLAIQLFDSSKGQLPASRTFWNYAKYRANGLPAHWNSPNAVQNTLTWAHEIMPYVEQQTMRNRVDEVLLTGTGSVQQVAGRLNIFICPSDTPDDNPHQAIPYSQLSYAVNTGVLDNYLAPNPAATGFDWPQNGVFDNRMKGRADTHLVNKSTSYFLRDGASNTISLADNIDVEEWNYAPDEIHVGLVWQDSFNPIVTINKYPPGLNPPNTKPDTLANLFRAGQGANYARPSSNHVSGVNVAFCDGSVRFIDESIDYETYARLMTSEGKAYMPAGINDSTSSATVEIRRIQSLP